MINVISFAPLSWLTSGNGLASVMAWLRGRSINQRGKAWPNLPPPFWRVKGKKKNKSEQTRRWRIKRDGTSPPVGPFPYPITRLAPQLASICRPIKSGTGETLDKDSGGLGNWGPFNERKATPALTLPAHYQTDASIGLCGRTPDPSSDGHPILYSIASPAPMPRHLHLKRKTTDGVTLRRVGAAAACGGCTCVCVVCVCSSLIR